MKVAHVAVYLDAVQAQKIRDDAQDAVLALDEDIEITTQIADLNAKRDIYIEIADKLQDACEKLNCGEYDLLESD